MRISDGSSDVCSSDLADALDGAFDAVLAAEVVDELKASVAALKTQVDAQAVAASRLPLDGAKGAADPARDAFVERYLRRGIDAGVRSEEHTSELQSLMRISYAVFCLKKKNTQQKRPKEDN